MSEIYERNINVSVSKIGEELILTKASLLDLNHNIRVELTVHVPTKTIREAKAVMVKSPFKICQLTLRKMQSVVGLTIERGIHAKLVDAIGRAEGCTHMVDLTMEAVRLSANVLLGFSRQDEEWRDRKLTDDEFIAEVKPMLKNSCLPFKDDGENTGPARVPEEEKRHP
ncbi:MAG: DUF2889 domain-containing protein [Ignavibacteria bacterium]|nr:DUF2889 domain-containing protein [Ignavibacteria bacterium]